MRIKPLFDRVVLKPIKYEEKNKSKLITDIIEDRPDYAEVIDLGTGGKIDGENIEFKVKIGDKVIFNKFAANEYNIEGNCYILIKQVDIIAILEN